MCTRCCAFRMPLCKSADGAGSAPVAGRVHDIASQCAEGGSEAAAQPAPHGPQAYLRSASRRRVQWRLYDRDATIARRQSRTTGMFVPHSSAGPWVGGLPRDSCNDRGCGAQGALLRLRSAAQRRLLLRDYTSTARRGSTGMMHAFAFFGGVPQSSLRNDRCLECASGAADAHCARLFNGFRSHYTSCRSFTGKGNDKGAVEVWLVPAQLDGTASALCQLGRVHSAAEQCRPPPGRYPALAPRDHRRAHVRDLEAV